MLEMNYSGATKNMELWITENMDEIGFQVLSLDDWLLEKASTQITESMFEQVTKSLGDIVATQKVEKDPWALIASQNCQLADRVNVWT